MLSFPKNIDSFLLRSCIKRDNPTAFAMGFSYLSAAEFIRLFGILERPKGNWNSRRLLEQSRRLYLERSSPNKGS